MQVMLDTIGSDSANIPANTGKVAGYVTGSSDIVWSSTDWARFPHAIHVRIDQSADGHVPLTSDVLDVEPRAATADVAVRWIKARINAGIKWSTIYGGADALAAVQSALNAGGTHGWYYGHVNAWFADWNLTEAEASALLGTQKSGLTVVAVQWASPGSNPHTLVPGSTKTLAEANVDLSVTADTWPVAGPTPPPPPPVTVEYGQLVTGGGSSPYVSRTVASRDNGKTWS